MKRVEFNKSEKWFSIGNFHDIIFSGLVSNGNDYGFQITFLKIQFKYYRFRIKFRDYRKV